MARGWESKSVEAQQSEKSAEGERKRAPRLTAEQAASVQRRGLLELSRKRVVQQLQTASNPNQRNMLEAALRDLDRQIRDLEARAPLPIRDEP